jgi:peptide deformylase
MPKLLNFVAKNNPILREIMPDVVDFNNPAFQETIKDMCYSILPAQLKAANAFYESAAGMAANQWGLKQRIFIYTPEGSDEGKLMEVMINPSYEPVLKPGETEFTLSAAYEGCFSIPLTTGRINRYDAIKAIYYDPSGKRIERFLQGWEARVFQHETDHLNGKLFDGKLDHFAGPDCVDRIVFKDKQEMDDFWEKKVRPSRE